MHNKMHYYSIVIDVSVTAPNHALACAIIDKCTEMMADLMITEDNNYGVVSVSRPQEMTDEGPIEELDASLFKRR